jgi:hypothetical protein
MTPVAATLVSNQGLLVSSARSTARCAIEDGLYQPSILEAEKLTLMTQQKTASAPANVSVHLNLAAVYPKKAKELGNRLTISNTVTKRWS